ncbi:MAG: Fe(2+) transporter permease subunit FeoB [Rhodobacteraceae bacterium]|nr:Fe(2+) transporter permease subunit FeoB [Paracoccaceae bacterium]
MVPSPKSPETGSTEPQRTIAIVGNPNCGKTSLFNALTGSRQHVGNWPGVTVDRKEGYFTHDGVPVSVVDLPGVYSLSVSGGSSTDEQIARDYILARNADLVVNIVDASNLERNLYLTVQLIEMAVPTVIIMNMLDSARSQGLTVTPRALSDALGVPVFGVVATTGEGLAELRTGLIAASAKKALPTFCVSHQRHVEAAVNDIAPLFEGHIPETIDPRWCALKLLEDDATVATMASENARAAAGQAKASIASEAGEDADILIADTRFTLAHELAAKTARREGKASRSLTDRIDSVVLNRFLGIPIFLAVMYLMFLFTINVGNALIDFFDILAGTLFVDGFGHVLHQAGAPEWMVTVLAGGIGGGLQTVATFIPVIGCLFLFLSVLEDSGYMARAAFVMDRFMKALGLPGKSFVPMMVGFGCTVPAVMATRTLDNQRDRILTAVMAHFMSCGARLPVYALFAAAFFPVGGQNVVFALYLIGIGFAVATGLLLKNTVLAGQSSPFLLELPLYHRPTMRGVLMRSWERLKSFLTKAGKFIVVVAAVLTFFNSLGRDGTFGNENTENSVLASIGKTIIPVFEPMGIKDTNWPAAVGLFTGIFAKEVVIGTLDALYSQMAADATGEDAGAAEDTFNVWDGIGAAFATIPANFADLADRLLDPLGLDVVASSSLEEAAASQEVSVSTFGTMAEQFDGAIGAFAYLLVILLYSPCMSALASYYRELPAAWTVFVATYSTALGYGIGVLVYQAGTFDAHPSTATMWIGSVIGLMAAGIVWLMFSAKRRIGTPAPQPAE